MSLVYLNLGDFFRYVFWENFDKSFQKNYEKNLHLFVEKNSSNGRKLEFRELTPVYRGNAYLNPPP